MSVRFTLEDAIMAAWQTKSDIESLWEHYGDVGMSEDELANALVGISTLHEMRMTKLWSEFEKSLK